MSNSDRKKIMGEIDALITRGDVDSASKLLMPLAEQFIQEHGRIPDDIAQAIERCMEVDRANLRHSGETSDGRFGVL